MYQLEERILFDGAAVAAVVVANQQHNDAANNDAAKNDAAHNNQNQNQDQNQQAQQHNPHTQNHSDITKPNPDGVTQQHTGVDNLLAQALGLDSAPASAHNSSPAEKHVNVMVISTSLDNADAVASLADANTIVVKYDSHNTTSAQLLAQINESLQGKKADSIAFMSEAGDGQLSLFKDGKTTVTSLNDSVQQQFWHGVEGMLDSHGRVDFLASNLASTDAGKALVTEISHITGHETAASTDLTGNSTKGGDWNLEFTAGGQDARQVDLVQTYLNRNILDSFTAVIPADTIQHEVAFINSSVMSPEEIINTIKNLGDDVEIVMLEKGDAFAQITEYLQDKSNISAIHIISHGNDGFFRLGDTTVDADFVQAHQAELAVWGKSMTANGDIMLYGCYVAADAEGQAFVQQLAHATGADIAASTDNTGAAGNWTLEYHAGSIETAGFVFNSYSYNLANITVNTMIDVPIISLPDSIFSLRKAIAEANAGDEVVFANWDTLSKTLPSGGANYTINLSADLGQLVISKNITINGNIVLPSPANPVQAIVDARPLVDLDNDPDTPMTLGTATTRVFYVNAVSDATNLVTIQNMKIQAGHAVSTGGSLDPSNGAGGGIYIDTKASLVLNQVNVLNNAADVNGGGIYVAGKLQIIKTDAKYFSTTVENNSAVNSGGGIFKSTTGSLTIQGLSVASVIDIDNNTAGGSGGGIYSYGDLSLQETSLYGNSASGGSGGGIAVESGSAETYFYSVDFGSNVSAFNGGGISFTNGKSLTLEWCYIYGNTASGGDGGGIYYANNAGALKVITNDGRTGSNNHGFFYNNTASQNGGAIYVSNSSNVIVDFIEFSGNTASNSGGAIYVQTSGTISINEGNFIANTSTVSGGAIYYDGAGSLTVACSYLGYNSSGIGGGIYQLAGAMAVTNVTFYGNSAPSSFGGAIYMNSGTLTAAFCTFAYNAGSEGQVIYINDPLVQSTLSVTSSIILNNSVSGSQIWLSGNTNVSSFNYNIYSHWYVDSLNPAGHFIAQSVVDGTGNQVAHDVIESTYILDNIYLDSTPRINANYRTYTLAILYENSIAYTAGTSVAGVTHDQRGNTRTGTGVNGSSNSAPSVGAFEPIFYTTVNSKADTSQMQFTSEENARYFDVAKADGLTLREAVYWMDSYNRQAAYDSGAGGGVNYNNNHYVKFDATVFAADTNNTITLNYGAILVGENLMGYGTSKEIAISSVAVIDPLDPRNYGDVNDPVAYRAQDATGRITVDARGVSAVFAFTDRATVYLSNLTATNGYNKGDTTTLTNTYFTNYGGRGGGIHNDGALIMNNAVVSNSRADNDRSDGKYTSTGYGGGIYNSGVIQMYDTTITENTVTAYGADKFRPDTAGLGGGIYNTGSLTIERSTIDNNTAQGNIDYVASQSVAGGGIYNSGSLYVANTTITLNSLLATQAKKDTNIAGAGAAIYNNSGSAYLYYNTIVDNHTELNTTYPAVAPYSKAAVAFDGGTLYMADSILANNTVQIKSSPPVQYLLDIYISDPGIVDTSGVNGGHNIIGGFNYTAADPGPPVVLESGYNWAADLTNIVGDAYGSVNNLNLDSVLRYNGAKTMTYRVQDGSAAINSAVALTNFGQFTSLTTDQRGLSRSIADRTGDTTPNIGSYESLVQLTVTSNADSGVAPVNKGFNFTDNVQGWIGTATLPVTLRDAVYWADSEGQITIDPGVTAIQLKTQAINIIHGININTAGGPVVTVTAASGNRIFIVENTDYLPLVSVAMSNMVLKNGSAAAVSNNGHGGAIFAKENLSLTNVSVLNSNAAGLGGGIFAQTGDLTLVNSTVSGNTAGTGAGGIYSEANILTITGSSILSNTATTGDGGGLLAIGSIASVSGSTFGYNAANAGNGGAVYSNSSDFSMVNSTVSQNRAALNGGGLALIGGGIFDFTYVTIANNIAGTANGLQKYGGGIYISAGNMSIIDSIIANNYSVNTSTYDDFYAVGGTMSSATYSAVGSFFGFDFGLEPSNIVGDNSGIIQNLGLSSVLEDNGGNTMTLYLAQTSVVASAGTDVPGITTSQNGKTRKSPSPSMGAYESRVERYIYMGTGAVTDVNSWQLDGAGPAPASFNIVDVAFVFNDTATGNLSTVWDVNCRAVVEISGTTGRLDVAADGAIHSLTIPTHSSEKVSVNVLDSGALSLATSDFSKMTLLTLATTSTVEYSYAGTASLVIQTANYGNLIISGGGTKSASSAITVNGTLSVVGTTFKPGGTLDATDIFMDNGTISGGSNDINAYGNISTSGANNSITGRNIDIASMLYEGNITATNQLSFGSATLINGTAKAQGISGTGAIVLDRGILTANTLTISDTGSLSTAAGVLGDVKANSINSSAITIAFPDNVNRILVENYSTLTLNTGSADIIMNTDPGTAANTFRANNITVNPDGALEFRTTGNITLNGVTGTSADNITGTLTLSAKDIYLNGARFSQAELVLNNSATLNIGAGGFITENTTIFMGKVNITADTFITSNLGSLVFNSSITGNGNDLDLSAAGGVTLNNISNIGNLTVSGPSGITLQGAITSTGTVTFNHALGITGANSSLTAGTFNFAGLISGAGNLTLSASGAAVNNFAGVNMTGGLTLSKGSFASASDVTTGNLAVNSAAALDAAADVFITGNINNAGNLNIHGTLTLNGTGNQNIDLSGTSIFGTVVIDKTTGLAKLNSGTMDVPAFNFVNGNFTIGNGNLIITNTNAGAANYFITAGTGSLFMDATAAGTTFWVGGLFGADQLVLKTAGGTELVGVRTIGDITTQGSTITGIQDTVMRTWTVTRTGVGDLAATFNWQPIEEGSKFRLNTEVVVASTITHTTWTKAPAGLMPVGTSLDFTITSAGSFAVAGPSASFDSATTFKGLNNSNANSGGFYYPSIAVDAPPSEGEYSFDMMQLYLAESPLGNPLGVSIPGTGTDIGGEYANDFLTITTGESVYGAPNGERGVNTQWTPEETREPDPVGEELDRQLDDFFTELADNSMHEKHPAFKSEVEILLDKLLAS